MDSFFVLMCGVFAGAVLLRGRRGDVIFIAVGVLVTISAVSNNFGLINIIPTGVIDFARDASLLLAVGMIVPPIAMVCHAYYVAYRAHKR